MPTTDLRLARPSERSGRSSTASVALGLELARRIERTAALARRARRHVKGSDASGRRKALKQVESLRELLRDLEQDALTVGVTAAFVEDARRLLHEADDHLDRLIGKKKLKKRHLRRGRKDLRDVRRRLEALIGRVSAPASALVAVEATPASPDTSRPADASPPSGSPPPPTR